MSQQEKLEKISNEIRKNFDEKVSTRIFIVSENRYGDKNPLKIKFYQSVLDGYIKPNDLWTSDENIENIKNMIESTPENKREKVILEILDTYDTSDPKIKDIIRKYRNMLLTIRP